MIVSIRQIDVGAEVSLYDEPVVVIRQNIDRDETVIQEYSGLKRAIRGSTEVETIV